MKFSFSLKKPACFHLKNCINQRWLCTQLLAVPVLGFFTSAWVFISSARSFLMQTSSSQSLSDKVPVYCIFDWFLPMLIPNYLYFLFSSSHLCQFFPFFASLSLPHPSLSNCRWWRLSIFPGPEYTVIFWQPRSHYRTGGARACHNDTHPESITTASNADTNIFQQQMKSSST